MRTIIAALLLVYFLSTLEEIHSQTAPYVRFLGVVLPNHSYVDLASVGDTDDGSDNVQCRTDLATCCSADEGSHRGDWYAPGSLDYLPFPPRSSGVFHSRQPQRVDLRYAGGGGTSGMYRCYIETVAVHDEEARETVYVGLYSSGGDITISGGMAFTLDSELNGQTPQFTLTCTSIGGPATTVSWTRDSEEISGGLTVLDDTVDAQYTHTLTVMGRLEGLYICNISNSKPSTAAAELTVEAPDPPSGLTVSQSGLDSVLVSWTAPSGGAAVTGFTVYYQPVGEERSSLSVGASATNSTISGLIGGTTYSITVVATSNTLPSTVTGPQNITFDPLMISLSLSNPSPVAGSSLTLTCSVTLPNTAMGTPVFEWVGPGDTPVPAAPSASGQVFTSTLTLSAVRASQAGQYICNSSLNGMIHSHAAVDVIVQIPAPMPSILTSRSTPLYAGTSFSLTCNFSLSPSVDTNPDTALAWRVSGTAVDTSPDRISDTGENLDFSPLATSDSGSYTCEVTITAQEYTTVEGVAESALVEIIVEDLPPPEVSTSMNFTVTSGDQRNLECNVSVVPFLTVAPTVQWIAPNNSVVASGSDSNLTYPLNLVRTSDAGQYTCQVTVDILSVGVAVSSQDSTTLTVQISLPSVTITEDHTAPLYAGTGLTLRCMVSLDSSVDAFENVLITWTGPRTIPGERYSIMEASGFGGMHAGSLTISPLVESQDDGQYTCSVTVSGRSSVLEATDSDSTTLEVMDLPIPLVNITTNGDSIAGANYSLQCSVSVVDYLVVQPDVELVAPNGGTVASQMNTTVLTHTLSPLTTSDGGEYTCMATLIIPDAGITNLQNSATKTITVVVAYPVELFEVTSSNSTVLSFSWQPPTLGSYLITGYQIACIPLLEGIPSPQPLLTGSESTTASHAGLYPGVTYMCSIVSVAPAGSSEPRNLTYVTTEIAPSGAPADLQANAGEREVTLSWSPPDAMLRNGNITGYTVTCSPSPSSLQQSFPQSGAYTVRGFSPGITYNCSVVAYNSQGSGPPAFTLFTTEEDDHLFQLRLTGLADCTQWVAIESVLKLSDITADVQRQLADSCKCQVTIDRDSFSCFDQYETSVSYRAQLSGTSEADGDLLISLLEDWISTGPSIRVRGVLMKVDATCDVTISDFNDDTCFSEDDGRTSSQTDNTGSIVGGAVAVILIVTLAVALTIIVVAFIMRRRKRHGEFSVGMAAEYPMTALPSHKGAEQVSIIANTNVAYEVVTPQKEKFEEEANHTYEVIPNPAVYSQPRPHPMPAKDNHYDVPKPSHVHRRIDTELPPPPEDSGKGGPQQAVYESISGDQ